tara:strand:+ start:364 stop:627 length:264 start_codon:yes stop_codon:yes gene_type:complete
MSSDLQNITNKSKYEAEQKKLKKLNMTENGVHIYYQCNCGSVLKDQKGNKKRHEKVCSYIRKKQFEEYKKNNPYEYEKLLEHMKMNH